MSVQKKIYTLSSGSWSAESEWNQKDSGSGVGATSYRTIARVPIPSVSGRKGANITIKNVDYVTAYESPYVDYYVYTSLSYAESDAKRQTAPSSGKHKAYKRVNLNSNGGTITISLSDVEVGTSSYIYILFTRSNSVMRFTGFSGWTVSCTTSSYSYTKCTPPTSITLDGNKYDDSEKSYRIVSAGDLITVGWSGAKGGTNNPISSDLAGVGVTSNFSVVDAKRVEATKTSGSVQIKLPENTNDYRGYSLRVRIYTYGKNYAPSGNYSQHVFTERIPETGTTEPRGCWINRLPSPPTSVAVSGQLPSEGKGTITLTPKGATDNDNKYHGNIQSITYYYSTSATGTKTKLSGSFETDQTEFYIWSKDGKEYSSTAKVVKITRNKKPQITGITCSKSETFKAKGASTWSDKATFSFSYNNVSSSGTFKTIIEFLKGNSTSRKVVASYTYNNKDKINSNGSSTTKEINVRSILMNVPIDFSSSDTYWRPGFIINNGLEDSDLVKYGGDLFAIPSAPTSFQYYNTESGEGRTDTVLFGDWVRVKFDKDEQCDPSAIAIEGISVSNLSMTTVNEKSVVKFRLSSSLSGGIKKPVLVFSGNGVSSFKKRASISFNVIPKPQIGTFSFPSIKPLSETRTLQATLEALDGSNQSAQAWGGAAIQYQNYNGEWFEAFSKQNFLDTASNDTKQLSIDATKIYNSDWKNDLGINKYNSVYTCSARAVLTNIFGQKFYSNPTNFTLDFREAPKLESTKFFARESDSVNWEPFYLSKTTTSDSIEVGPNLLQEGKFKFKIGLSSISEGSGEVIIREGGIQKGTHHFEVSPPLQTDTGWQASKIGPVEISIDIPEITNLNSKTYEIVINGPGGSCSETVTFQVAPQYDPNIIITDVSLSQDEKTLTVEFSKNADPSTLSFKFGDYIGKVSENTVSFSSQSKFFGDSWTTKNIQLDIISTTCTSRKINETTYTPCFERGKNYVSSSYLFYNTVPTVAYRENHLGINTSTPNEDTILDIRALTDKKKIQFKDEATGYSFLLDSSAGTFTITSMKKKEGTDEVVKTEYVFTFD